MALLSTLALVPAACSEDLGPPFPSNRMSVDAGPDIRTPPGEPAAVTFRINHPRGQQGPWGYRISWGDGAVDSASVGASGRLLRARHTYAAQGDYRIVVSASRDSATAQDSLTAVVEPHGTPQVLVGAGDIGECGPRHAAATATLLDHISGTVFTAGDNAYPSGSTKDYARCYRPFWGRHRKRTRPALGNHDYDSHAAGYFAYFGVAAGDSTRGYYSYDLGDWHIVVLNSNIDMAPGSAQERWLRADLGAHPQRCTLAMWHHPTFSSGTNHGSQRQTLPLWRDLDQAGADVVVVAHEHNYERFAPQTANGVADPAHGIREFVVGTGGGDSYRFGAPIANSEARSTDHGVLKLTLSSTSYTWEFIPEPGATFTDSGSGNCH